MLTLQEQSLDGKRVIIRVDFNVPVAAGKVTNTARIEAVLPTIEYVLAQRASVILLSHFGRPTEGEPDPQYSLAPVVAVLAQMLGRDVQFATDYSASIAAAPGTVTLMENVRFQVGESADDPALAQRLAALGDIFVMDAFASAHRAHASTHGIVQFIPLAVAGLLLQKEMQALQQAMQHPEKPVVAIVGGAKVSTKLAVLGSFIKIADQIVVGGGIANTFLAACGHPVGRSLYEPDLLPQAQAILQQAAAADVTIILPTDVVVATEFSASAEATIKPLAAVAEDEMILDIGPDAAAHLSQTMQSAKTIIWNGPVGVFEFPAFAAGTKALAQAIAQSPAFSLAGGGDTLAAIDTFDVASAISYISTGGGAFLEFIEGKTLPGIAALTDFATR